jgi:hypothetical protein
LPFNGSRRDLLALAFAVHPQRVTRVALEPQVHVGDAKAGEDEARAAFDEVIGAAQIADGIEVPPVPRLLADDITPEAAASLLAEQGGRLAIISAEGGIFDIIAGRYSPKAVPTATYSTTIWTPSRSHYTAAIRVQVWAKCGHDSPQTTGSEH